MPRISTQEFERLPLRVHDFLAGVPLHDVWAVDLPPGRSGITLESYRIIVSHRDVPAVKIIKLGGRRFRQIPAYHDRKRLR